MRQGDEQLVRSCLEGDRKSFEQLVERYERPIFNLALRMVGNAEDARDVAQNTFVAAFRKLATFDPDRRFFSWIYRIAIHESLDLLGRRQPHEPIDAGRPAAGGGPDAALDSAERTAAVTRALMGLPPDQRSVVVLRHYRNCTYREMAEILGIPEKTVKSRLFTARQALRQALAGSGVLAPWMRTSSS